MSAKLTSQRRISPHEGQEGGSIGSASAAASFGWRNGCASPGEGVDSCRQRSQIGNPGYYAWNRFLVPEPAIVNSQERIHRPRSGPCVGGKLRRASVDADSPRSRRNRFDRKHSQDAIQAVRSSHAEPSFARAGRNGTRGRLRYGRLPPETLRMPVKRARSIAPLHP